MTQNPKAGKDSPRYEDWESHLFQTLSPVDPDPAFIHRLRERLEGPGDVAVEAGISRRALAASLLIAAAFLVIVFTWILRDTRED